MARDDLNMFERLFDLNRDGELDFGERWLAPQIFEECTKDDTKHTYYRNSGRFYDDDDTDDIDDDWRDFCEDGSECGVDPDNYENEDEYNEALEEAKYGWRDDCEDGSEFGVDPDNYNNEEEYNEALEEAKYGWRDFCEDGFEFGVDPNDYETEDEYNEALEEAKYGWRDYCDDGSEYDIDPEDYETEDEYYEALHEARNNSHQITITISVTFNVDETEEAEYEEDDKYEWREYCENGTVYGVKPEDYETEEEYEIALDKAKYPWRAACEEGSEYGVDPEDYETTHEYYEALAEAQQFYRDPLDDIKPEDYPNKRKYNAAYHVYSELQDKPEIEPDSELAMELARCNFILHSDALAAQYLTVYDGFLLAQAIKEHFDVSIKIPKEDAEPKTSFYTLLPKIAKKDAKLAMQIWLWCYQQFGPYMHYIKPDDDLRDIVYADLPEAFIDLMVKELAGNSAFRRWLLEESYEFQEISNYVIHALKNQWGEAAAAIFSSVLSNPVAAREDIENFVMNIHSDCCWGNEPLFDYYRTYIVPVVETSNNARVQKLYQQIVEDVEAELAELREEDELWDDNIIDYPEEPDINQNQYIFCGVIFPPQSATYYYRTNDDTLAVGDDVVVPVGNHGREEVVRIISVAMHTRKSAPYPVDKAKFIKGKV